jgi:type I restriction enzyme S subunit
MANLYKPAGIPFLRSQNIRPFSVSMQNMVFIDEAFHAALAKSSLQAGDVAIVRTGYPGTAAVIPDSLGVANCSDLVIVRPGPEIDAHFLTAFFNSSFGKSMVSGKVVGAAQKHFRQR